MSARRNSSCRLAAVVLAIGAAFMCTASTSSAQKRLLAFGLLEENDTFTNSDSSYTQGLRLNFAFRLPEWLPGTSKLIRCDDMFAPSAQPCYLGTFAIGQAIYTSDSINVAAARPRSRPYAGFLYLAPGIQRLKQYRAVDRPLDTSVAAELLVGTVGERSLAREAQSLFHWGLAHGALRPKGWDNQIRNAPIVNLRVAPRVRALELCAKPARVLGVETCEQPKNHRWFDLVANLEGALGNYQRFGAAGALARLGWNLPSDFGPSIIPVAAGLAAAQTTPPWYDRFALGLHAGVTAKYYTYNRLIEGGNADDNGLRAWSEIRPVHGVDERVLGGFIGLGSYVLAYQRVWRSHEFTVPGQPADRPRLRFANISITRAIN